MRFTLSRAALAGIGLALGASLAGPAPAVAQTTPAPAQPAPAAAVDPKAVVASVGGQPVTEADLSQALEDLGQQFAQLPAEQQRAAALSAIIEIRVMAAEAKTKGYDKDADFQRRAAFLQLRALHSELVDKEVADKLTDKEVRDLYDQQIASSPPVNEVHARHILVKTQEEAQEIIKQLDAGGDFQAIANEKTTDPSGKTSGGDLGFFGPGQMVPEFEQAAFALEAGTYTKEPVQSPFGWHVIKVEEKRAQQPPAFEQVEEQLRTMAFRNNYFALVKGLRGQAEVSISDPALKTAVDALEAQQQ